MTFGWCARNRVRSRRRSARSWRRRRRTRSRASARSPPARAGRGRRGPGFRSRSEKPSRRNVSTVHHCASISASSAFTVATSSAARHLALARPAGQPLLAALDVAGDLPADVHVLEGHHPAGVLVVADDQDQRHRPQIGVFQLLADVAGGAEEKLGRHAGPPQLVGDRQHLLVEPLRPSGSPAPGRSTSSP